MQIVRVQDRERADGIGGRSDPDEQRQGGEGDNS